jgi:hypothetical protein
MPCDFFTPICRDYHSTVPNKIKMTPETLSADCYKTGNISNFIFHTYNPLAWHTAIRAHYPSVKREGNGPGWVENQTRTLRLRQPMSICTRLEQWWCREVSKTSYSRRSSFLVTTPRLQVSRSTFWRTLKDIAHNPSTSHSSNSATDNPPRPARKQDLALNRVWNSWPLWRERARESERDWRFGIAALLVQWNLCFRLN